MVVVPFLSADLRDLPSIQEQAAPWPARAVIARCPDISQLLCPKGGIAGVIRFKIFCDWYLRQKLNSGILHGI